MATHHRNLLPPKIIDPNHNHKPLPQYELVPCPKPCGKIKCVGDDLCEDPPVHDDPLHHNPPPVPPLLQPNQEEHHMQLILIILFCLLSAAFLFVSYLIISRKFRSNSTDPPQQFEDNTHQEFIDEDHGPVLDNPIWYIHTVGLQQSVIDSIAVIKYKIGEGLVEGTDCSVCLSEFEEDESLRLLPKCSHAFHISCIDAWLRSHKNCPLCRAPITSNGVNGAVLRVTEPNSINLGPRVVNPSENLVDFQGLRRDLDDASEVRVGNENLGTFPDEEETIVKILDNNDRYFSGTNSEFRVRSDLGDQRDEVEEETQPKRRSISMDSSSASTIYRAMPNTKQVENRGCGTSTTEAVQVKKSSSMKRSFSSSGNIFFPRSSRSQDSSLPL